MMLLEVHCRSVLLERERRHPAREAAARSPRSLRMMLLEVHYRTLLLERGYRYPGREGVELLLRDQVLLPSAMPSYHCYPVHLPPIYRCVQRRSLIKKGLISSNKIIS